LEIRVPNLLREYHRRTGNNIQQIKTGDVILMYDRTAQLKTTVGDTVERPHRRAAQRGRERVKNWVKQLGGAPEDVMD